MGSNGQLGILGIFKSSIPIKVPCTDKILDICCGSTFSAALDASYELHVWGNRFALLKLNNSIPLPLDRLNYQIGCIRDLLLATWHSGLLVRDFTKRGESSHILDGVDCNFQNLEETFLELTKNTYKYLKLTNHSLKIHSTLLSKKLCDTIVYCSL